VPVRGRPEWAKRIPTGEFYLRGYASGDADVLWQMVELNRDRLMRNFAPFVAGLTSAAVACDYIAERMRAWDNGTAFTYGIWRQDKGELVGQITVKNVDWRVPSGELSYFVSRVHLRCGVASAAIRGLLREAFITQGFKRVYVRVIASNEESLALARRMGFRHEGVHRKDFRCGYDELHDVHYFGLTDDDYGR